VADDCKGVILHHAHRGSGLIERLVLGIAFGIAFVTGFLAWIARNVWVDRKKTQFFVALSVISTLVFVVGALLYL